MDDADVKAQDLWNTITAGATDFGILNLAKAVPLTAAAIRDARQQVECGNCHGPIERKCFCPACNKLCEDIAEQRGMRRAAEIARDSKVYGGFAIAQDIERAAEIELLDDAKQLSADGEG